MKKVVEPFFIMSENFMSNFGRIMKCCNFNIFFHFLVKFLRVNITIVYEHTVCATSAFSVCKLRVVFNVDFFDIVCLGCFCSKNIYIETHYRYECCFLKCMRNIQKVLILWKRGR